MLKREGGSMPRINFDINVIRRNRARPLLFLNRVLVGRLPKPSCLVLIGVHVHVDMAAK